jgi:hypothetical protein
MHPSNAKNARVSTPLACYPCSMHKAAGGLWQAMAPVRVHPVAAAPVRPAVINSFMDRVEDTDPVVREAGACWLAVAADQ